MTNNKIAIAGGGLVGSVAALALSKIDGIDVHVIDKASKNELLNINNDGRTTAVNYASSILFKNLGVWDELRLKAEPIWKIQVMEGSDKPHTPWQVTYDSREDDHPMGYIVENDSLRKIVLENAFSSENIKWHEKNCVVENISKNCERIIKLSNESEITTNLFIGCEGKNSPTRRNLSMKEVSFSYGQKAFVFHVLHEKAHENRAFEIFLPKGPLAFLPMKSEEHPENMSGIVWSCDIDRFNELKKLSNEELEKEVVKFFPYYGSLKISSKIWEYPLTGIYVPSTIDDRCVIIGDAAHGIHPIAGQGVNLGWRDAALLYDTVKDHYELGLDIGATSTLMKYEKNCKIGRNKVSIATNAIFKLFNNDYKSLKFIRNMGLAITEKLPFAKNELKKQAMGLISPLPSLYNKM